MGDDVFCGMEFGGEWKFVLSIVSAISCMQHVRFRLQRHSVLFRLWFSGVHGGFLFMGGVWAPLRCSVCIHRIP